MTAPERVRLYEREYVGSEDWSVVHPDIPEDELPGDATYTRSDIAEEWKRQRDLLLETLRQMTFRANLAPEDEWIETQAFDVIAACEPAEAEPASCSYCGATPPHPMVCTTDDCPYAER